MLVNFEEPTTNQSMFPLLERLNVVRLLVVLVLAFGYATTMPYGPGTAEWGNLFGYDPSWLAIQLLFFISGLLAMRSVEAKRVGMTYLASRFRRNLPTLFLLTIATLLILFPLFGTPSDQGVAFFLRLAKYVALTVFCIDPGIPIEGLFDDARYMCLVQGGIWTLRFGVILHLLTAISGRLGLLTFKPLLLTITVFTTVLYGLGTYVAVKSDLAFMATPLAGLRLSYAFLIGMCFWSYRDVPNKRPKILAIVALILFSATALNYYLGPWSSTIEIGLTTFWMLITWGALNIKANSMPRLKRFPNLTLPVMLINWPLAQTILLFQPDITTLGLITFTLFGTIMLSLIYLFGTNKAFLRSASHPPKTNAIS